MQARWVGGRATVDEPPPGVVLVGDVLLVVGPVVDVEDGELVSPAPGAGFVVAGAAVLEVGPAATVLDGAEGREPGGWHPVTTTRHNPDTISEATRRYETNTTGQRAAPGARDCPPERPGG